MGSNARKLLTASSVDGGISIAVTSWARSINFIGATVPVSFFPGTTGTAFMANPNVGGLIAVSVQGSMAGNSQCNFFDFFLPVFPDQSGFLVDLDKLCVPFRGRMGQIVDHKWIMVQIDGEFFSNEPDDCRHESIQYVSDPNLLCRYLVGMATADEVKTVNLTRQSRIFEEACHRHAHAEWMSLRKHFGIDGPESVSQAVIAAYEALKGQVEMLQRDLTDERVLHAEESEIRSRLERECMELSSMIITAQGTLLGAIRMDNSLKPSAGSVDLPAAVVGAVAKITELRKVLASVAAEADGVWFGLNEIRGIVASARKRGLLPSK